MAALAAFLVAFPFALPYVGGAVDTADRILDWGLFGLGFDLLFGFTGLLSFGQAAFYGVGGFVTAWLLVTNVTANAIPALPTAKNVGIPNAHANIISTNPGSCQCDPAE